MELDHARANLNVSVVNRYGDTCVMVEHEHLRFASDFVELRSRVAADFRGQTTTAFARAAGDVRIRVSHSVPPPERLLIGEALWLG
jgi:hypothetical protein